jgi:hypothetical protein
MRRHLGWVSTTMVLGVLVALVAGIDTGNILSLQYDSLGIGPPLILLGVVGLVVADIQALRVPPPVPPPVVPAWPPPPPAPPPIA